MKTDYINNVIKSIDERIVEAEEILKFLRGQKRQALLAAGGNANWKYVVPSRSGGDNHRVSWQRNYETYCSCKADLSGRKCWARKGIETDIDIDGNPKNSSFFDEKYVRHFYGASTISFLDAELARNPW